MLSNTSRIEMELHELAPRLPPILYRIMCRPWLHRHRGRVLIPSTTKRCLHGLEALFVADVPARRFVDAGPRLRGTLDNAELILRGTW